MAVILVVTSAPPLVDGGHMVIARALERALREAGHRAGIVTTPGNRFGRQASGYLATWLTDIGRTGDGAIVDQVISLRFPSYAVRHPRHTCWLNHTMREYYDLWDGFSAALSPQGRLKERVRRAAMHAADSYFLKQHVTDLLAQSETIRARLRRWNHVDADVLHPPPPPRAYRCDGYGDYLFFASRLTPLKRADLLLRGLAQPAARHVRCVIGGDGESRADLDALASTLGVAERVTFVGRLDDEALVDHLARCRGVVFAPKSEDYGFVTVEAYAAAKPVITATDSGGPLDFVRHEHNGLVVEPTPEALGAAMGRLMDSPTDAEAWGRQGAADTAGLTWPAAVQRLTTPGTRG